jgi:4-oxalocrotonate tautomerase family enzyme
MPFVQIITGTDFLTSEQKIKLNKAVMESMLRVFQEEKGIKPSIDIIIQEHPPDNFLINGETLTEVRKKR